MSREKLIVTDINGTIHTSKDGIPKEVLAGFARLQQNGSITTITTGRSATKANDLLGSHRQQIVTPDSPISLENGGRLLSSDQKNIKFYAIPEDTLAASIALAQEIKTAYVAYSPKDPLEPTKLWLMQDQKPDRFIKENGVNVSVCGGTLVDFASEMYAAAPCMLRIGTDSTDAFRDFPDTSVFLNLGEVNLLAGGVSKARGVIDLAEYFEIGLEHVLVAGNDSNDIPMFDLPVGVRVFVETEAVDYRLPNNVVRFPTVQSFGDFLLGAA